MVDYLPSLYSSNGLHRKWKDKGELFEYERGPESVTKVSSRRLREVPLHIGGDLPETQIDLEHYFQDTRFRMDSGGLWCTVNSYRGTKK